MNVSAATRLSILRFLKTFPRSFRIDGPRVEIQRQIGNAVPSLLAEALAREIVSQVTGKSFSGRYNLEVERAQTIAPPEPVFDVPQEYLPLLGKHAPHPGTVKGRSYQNNHPQKTQPYFNLTSR
ncbi:MAG: DNA cytosine methyltransferase [Actinobacteria bacterium]|nr:DNA cytosine methyltransferase [Actinomycetota bacterium]